MTWNSNPCVHLQTLLPLWALRKLGTTLPGSLSQGRWSRVSWELPWQWKGTWAAMPSRCPRLECPGCLHKVGMKIQVARCCAKHSFPRASELQTLARPSW